MSNSIWKMPDQKPDSRKQILIYDGVDYSIEISHPEYWEDKGLVEKWCYLDQLLAQADKAERLQKAVDLALDTLKKAETTRELTVKGHYVHAISLDELHSALKEIKQLTQGNK